MIDPRTRARGYLAGEITSVSVLVVDLLRALEAAEAREQHAQESANEAANQAADANMRAAAAEQELKQWYDLFDASLTPIPPNSADPDSAE